jgi:MOSC domain-containing protein YiiM
MNKNIGQVLELFISKKDKSKRFSRTILEVDNKGILDDKFYAKDLERSILLTSTDSYDLALKNSIEMSYGALGENILIDYNPYSLVIGSHIQIGEVVVEVTQNCTICNHLSSIDKTLPNLLKDDRGIFVKVVEVGFIEKGDKLYLL